MKASDSSGILTIMIGHKEYVLSPLCVQEEPDELINSKTKIKHSPTIINFTSLEVNANPDLVLKVHSLLAESNPAVLAYAAQLGDQHVIKEYLKNFPNEVFIVIL